MYNYKARVKKVLNGHTYLLVIDLGFGLKLLEKITLRGVTTKNEAKKYVKELIEKEDVVVVPYQSKKNHMGQYIADIILDNGKLLSNILLKEKLAIKCEDNAK